MTYSSDPRVAPLWEWARATPSRPVLTTGGAGCIDARTLDVRARRLAAALSGAPGTMLLVGVDLATAATAYLAAAQTGTAVVVAPASAGSAELLDAAARHRVRYAVGAAAAEAIAAVRGHLLDLDRLPDAVPADPRLAASCRVVSPSEPCAVGPPGSADSAARALALVADVVGLSRDGAVAFALPHLNPATLSYLGGLLHARRHVVAVEAMDAAVTDVVSSRPDAERVAQWLRTSGADLARVVALGRVTEDGLRERLVQLLGTDLLVEYGIDQYGNATVATPPGMMAGFWSWAAEAPERVAVEVVGGSSLTAGELDRTARRLAGVLHQAAPCGTALAAVSDPGDVVAALLAATLSGVRLAVAPPSPAEDIARRVVAAGAGAVVVDAASRMDVAAKIEVPVLTIGDLPESGALVAGLSAGGLLAETSGTTGAARFVRPPPLTSTSKLVGAYERVSAAALGIIGGGAHLVPAGVHQAAALTMAIGALHAGQTLVVAPQWSPVLALELLQRVDITTAFMVPSMFMSLLQLRSGHSTPPAALRSVVHSAAPCPVEVKQAMIDWWGDVVYEHYGASEGIGTYVTPAEWRDRPGTVGKPFPGVAVRVLDEDGAACPPRVVGDVYISDNGFSYDDGSEPHHRRQGLVALGDRGFLDEDGWLYLSGRGSEYVNVGGTKFHPSEVEDVLRTGNGVADCAARGIPHAHLGQVLAVYVVPADGAEANATRRRLLALARAKLPIHQVPLRVVFVDRLPRDSNGKLRRRELPVTE